MLGGSLVGISVGSRSMGRFASQKLFGFRQLSVNIGYDCNAYVDNERDVATIDKLLVSTTQVRSFYVSGDRIGYRRVYETLIDATMTNETINLTEYNIGHKLSNNCSNWKEEMDTVHDIIDIKHLRSVVLPINVGITENISDLILTRTGGTSVILGIELSTEYIVTNTHDDAIEAVNKAMRGNRFGIISIAFNSFTCKKALSIYNYVRKTFPNTKVNVVDLLRAHPRKPGLLTIESGYKLGSKEIKVDEKDTKITVQSSIAQSVEDFKRSLDRCIHLEKQILTKLATNGHTSKVSINSLCWGSILSGAQSDILFPEEWGYVVDFNIMNELNKERAKLDNIGTEYREWMSLYLPMAKYLFSSFLVLQNYRKYMLLVEICDAINAHHDRVVVTATELPRYMCHAVTALVDRDQGDEQVEVYTSQISVSPKGKQFPKYSSDEALVVVDIVRNILDAYGKVE